MPAVLLGAFRFIISCLLFITVLKVGYLRLRVEVRLSEIPSESSERFTKLTVTTKLARGQGQVVEAGQTCLHTAVVSTLTGSHEEPPDPRGLVATARLELWGGQWCGHAPEGGWVSVKNNLCSFSVWTGLEGRLLFCQLFSFTITSLYPLSVAM